MGITVKALIGVIIALNTQIAALEEEISESFDQHPDATIVRSLPGLATVLGAQVLAEFGEDPNGYDNAKSREDYAARHPSPGPPATPKSSSPATPATSAWPTLANNGPSPP